MLVANIRRNRVLAGWPFTEADESARGLVIAALNQVGAVRPKWIDGQPFLTSRQKTCPTCGAEWVRLYGPGADRGREAGGARFCSFACLREAAKARARLPEYRAKKYASRERRRETMAPRVCDHCGNGFHPRPDTEHQRFCSMDCFHASITAEQHETRACAHCGGDFTPEPGVRGQNRKFCSIPCRDAAKGGNPPRRCIQCGDLYQPRPGKVGSNSRFCGPACYQAFRRAKANVFACEPCD